MSHRRSLRDLPLFSVAVMGALGGHWIAYAVALDAKHRNDVLASTGHGYLPVAVQLSTVLLLGAAGTILLRHLDAGRATRAGHGADALALTLRLCGVQVVLFLSMEVAERLVAGAPLAGLLGDGLLATGVLSQLVLAAIGAGALLLMHRAGAGLAAAIVRRLVARPEKRPVTRPVAIHRPALLPLASAGGLRGPPS